MNTLDVEIIPLFALNEIFILFVTKIWIQKL